MPPTPSTLQWTTSFILLTLFSWVLLSLLWEIVPIPWSNTDKPQKRFLEITILVVIGMLNYSFASEVLGWVWMGIRHILGLDLEGL